MNIDKNMNIFLIYVIIFHFRFYFQKYLTTSCLKMLKIAYNFFSDCFTEMFYKTGFVSKVKNKICSKSIVKYYLKLSKNSQFRLLKIKWTPTLLPKFFYELAHYFVQHFKSLTV